MITSKYYKFQVRCEGNPYFYVSVYATVSRKYHKKPKLIIRFPLLAIKKTDWEYAAKVVYFNGAIFNFILII